MRTVLLLSGGSSSERMGEHVRQHGPIVALTIDHGQRLDDAVGVAHYLRVRSHHFIKSRFAHRQPVLIAHALALAIELDFDRVAGGMRMSPFLREAWETIFSQAHPGRVGPPLALVTR